MSSFGCELLNSGIPINVSFYGLVGGPWPTSCASNSIRRTYSQTTKAGTRNRIISMEGGTAEVPDSSKKISGAKKIRKGKSKQPKVSPEVRCNLFI